MAIFSQTNSYLGVDIGSSSIKVVELANFKGRPRLVTYGFTEKNPSRMDEGSTLSNIEETADALKDICDKAKTSAKKAVTAMPNFLVFTSILNLPALNKKELDSAISWEAKKIIPIPLEDIILDWKVVPEGENKPAEANGATAAPAFNSAPEDPAQTAQAVKKIFAKPNKNLKILLTGASRNLANKYVKVFNQAGLNLISLETENFALIRSLIGNDKSTIMLVDLGASTSGITVVDKGVPMMSRSLELGGLSITRSIASSLNISFERSEQFKQDMALDGETAENVLPQTVEKAIGPIINEIKYTLNLYQDQNGKSVEKIFLTGGCSLLGHLPAYLSRVLNVNTYIGDPWARVVFPTELKPILDRLGARFAVAIGLAMRDID